MPLAGSGRIIGVIAGGGQFPFLFCRAARRDGYRVVVAALEGEADPALDQAADECHWVKLGQLGRLISAFKKAGVDQAVMLGQVRKARIFSRHFRPDLKALSLLPRAINVHDDAMLRLFAQALEEEGIVIRESTLFLPWLLVPLGRLSKRQPSKREMKDAEYGFNLAKELGRLDIGQCLVVRSRAVLAVEAIEGTDETIRRGGSYGGGRAVVIKVAKPDQDLRFDLPAIGVGTIESMLAAGCTCLVVEAGKTICFDREEMLALADRSDLAVLALEADK